RTASRPTPASSRALPSGWRDGGCASQPPTHRLRRSPLPNGEGAPTAGSAKTGIEAHAPSLPNGEGASQNRTTRAPVPTPAVTAIPPLQGTLERPAGTNRSGGAI